MRRTYLTTEQLAERIHYNPRTIRNRLKDSVLLEGIHYIRPFGGRKLLFIWEAIEEDMSNFSMDSAPLFALNSGNASNRATLGTVHGANALPRTQRDNLNVAITSVALVVQGIDQIGSCEIIALEQQRLAGYTRQGVGEAVAKIQAGRVANLAVIEKSLAGQAALLQCYRLDADLRTIEEEVDLPA